MDVTRATLAFNKTEDRISLTCALENDEHIILWLTARLVRQLVPHLVQLTTRLPKTPSKVGRQEVVAEADSAGESSVSDLAPEGQGLGTPEMRSPESPVIAKEGSPSKVVTAIDITHSPMLVKLCFKEDQDNTGVWLSLEHTQLAQWLEGVKQCFVQAGWATDCWHVSNTTDYDGSATPRAAVH